MRLLGRVVVVGIACLLCLGAVAAWTWVRAPLDTFGDVQFVQPLRVPPLAPSRLDRDGRRVFSLTARAGRSELLPGTTSDTWGFNGSYLGPTLRAERGEHVALRVANQLTESTTVHWHGMHLPAAMDGTPHQPIEPGATWTPHWRVDQQAATLWYHPHPHGATEQHVYRGLAGMFIVDDSSSPAARRLPHRYGVDDVPVIVQDKRISDDGALEESAGPLSLSTTGHLGDTILVNGTYGPFLDVTTERVRLRLLNASSARVYDFGFSDDRAFALVASEGGLLPAPIRRTRLTLSPGERAEIVVRLQAGETVTLRSYPPDLGRTLARFDGGEDRLDVLQLRAADDLQRSSALPLRLSTPFSVDTSTREVDRRFELLGRSINDKRMDMSRVDEVVEVDTTEVWQVTNRDAVPHNFHVHDVQFQVLALDGSAPPVEYAGRQDTILLLPGSSARIAMRFDDYTDPDTPYMYHCHLLRHEDQGMMGQFVVVAPGQAAGRVHTHD